MRKALKQLFCLFLVFACVVFVSSCEYFPVNQPGQNPGQNENPGENEKPGENDKPNLQEKYDAISVAEAIEQATAAGATGVVAKVYGIVKNVVSTQYGEMYLTDGTVDFYIYGIEGYSTMAERPEKGDEVVLEGIICLYNETTPEMKRGTILEYIDGEEPTDDPKPLPTDVITVSEAVEIALAAGDAGTSTAVTVKGTVKNVTNPNYGEMYITDGVNELYIYGINEYTTMEDKPVQGYEVVLSGVLKTFKGSPEMGKADLISYVAKKPEINEEDYEAVSVLEARNAESGTLVKLTGVVACITYADGLVPNGILLVDETNSIYVYGKDVAGQVSVGNTVTIAGSKTYYILEKEQGNAAKFGYKGCNQIESAILLENDKQVSEYNKEWITETTVKEIMNTPYSEDITTTIFKVNAIVKKAVGTGFTNYYIDDLDDVTGTYSYTQASGADFAWLDEFDGKICTVYLSVQNAKSSASGCNWRFLPVEVIDEGYQFDESKAPEFALEYYAVDQFLESYSSDPALVVSSIANNEVLGFEGVLFEYESTNPEVAYFESNVPGEIVFHTKDYGTTTIIITATYKNYVATREIEVVYSQPISYEYVTVKEAIAVADEEIVTVKGIVAGGVINKTGFYLIDETGVITVTSTAEVVGILSVGDEVIVRGVRGHNDPTETVVGQSNIYDAEVLINNYGNHEYSTATFISGKTFADLSAISVNEEHSSEVYIVQAVITDIISTAYYTSMKLKDLQGNEFPLYMSSANQYSWLHEYAGETLTLELALCNWNKKSSWRGCILSATTEDGVKIQNTFNLLG